MTIEQQRKIVISDGIDMPVSFINWSGHRCLMEQLMKFTDTYLSVLTNTYIEATDLKAIQKIVL